MVSVEETVAGCALMLDDAFAAEPEQALYMIGPITDVRRTTEGQEMRLKICVQPEVLHEAGMNKVVEAAANTACCLFPRHVDCVAAVRIFT